jgi:hypothetical protein
VGFSYGRADTRMNGLPDRQIDVDDPPLLGRIPRPRDGHVKTLTARMGGDEANVPQEVLQVADEAWSIDDDVQAAWRSGVAATKSPSLTVVTKRRKSRGSERQQSSRGRPLDPRKFSYPTVISIDTERLPSVESARQPGLRPANWGSCSLERTRTKTISSTISRIRTGMSSPPGCERRSPRRCELTGKGSANEP